MVGGPGFEPGASRSRITRQFIQTCRFLRFSVGFFKPTRPERPDLHESSAGLLHELLHGLSTEVDGATPRCPPASGGAACVHTAARSLAALRCHVRQSSVDSEDAGSSSPTRAVRPAFVLPPHVAGPSRS